MKEIRRLDHESLECRKLLAASCVPLSEPVAVAEVSRLDDVIVASDDVEFSPAPWVDADLPGIPFLQGFFGGPDLLQEQGDQLFVVDQGGYGTSGSLLIFRCDSDGSLASVEKVEIGFHVERMIVRDAQVVLIGFQHGWYPTPLLIGTGPSLDVTHVDSPDRVFAAKTPVMTVNLGSDIEVIRQDLDQNLQVLDHSDDRLIMRSTYTPFLAYHSVHPAEFVNRLHVFEISEVGIRETASIETSALGLAEVRGDTIVVTGTRYDEIVYIQDDGSDVAGIRAPDDRPLPHYERVTTVAQFKVADQSIEKVDEFELGDGFVRGLEVSDDGRTAVVVRGIPGVADGDAIVDMLSLPGDRIERFESVAASGSPLTVDTDYVLLTDFNQTLLVVNTNQDIDLAAENRLRRIDIPDGFLIRPAALPAAEDQVVLMLERWQQTDEANAFSVPGSEPTRAPDSPVRRVFQSVVLTVSLADGNVIGDARLAEGTRFTFSYRFIEIDASSNRFGFFAEQQSTSEDRGRRFIFGRLGANGEFVRDGSIPLGDWIEVDADGERLIARLRDRLIEYRWESVENPTITYLREPPPAVVANHDQYELIDDGEDQFLDVLANDEIHDQLRHPLTRIVELIDAPDGAQIVGGRRVEIPASALLGRDSLRFEYVISDGRTESRAVVEATIISVSQETIEALIQSVRSRAAEDFGVPMEEVNITSVERIFNDPLPVVLPDDPDHPLDLSPGILVTLATNDATALYAASLSGQIVQVFAAQRERLVRLGLRAVNDRGEPLAEVVEGQEFWIEFHAQDLRDFGRGVFAAFFDLIVPTENLVLTGPIEYGDGFQSIRHGELGDGFADDVGAVGSQIEPPGSGTQRILRIGATAVAAGEITLTPEAADQPGAETLLHGRDTAVPLSSVQFDSMSLTIIDPPEGNPLDADGNGVVTAADALVVINFLHRFGTTPIAELAERIARARGEGESALPDNVARMRRYDTNASGTITALDALVVINRLSQQRLANDLSQSAFASMDIAVADDVESQLF